MNVRLRSKGQKKEMHSIDIRQDATRKMTMMCVNDRTRKGQKITVLGEARTHDLQMAQTDVWIILINMRLTR